MSCQQWPEEEFPVRVETIQDRTFNLLNLATDAMMDLSSDNKKTRVAGKPEMELSTAGDFQRKARFHLDFVEAERSSGFHAPQETARILGQSIDISRQGQNAFGGQASAPVAPAKGGKKNNILIRVSES